MHQMFQKGCTPALWSVWGWSRISAVGQSPACLSLFPQYQDFMVSQPEELLWSSRQCRLCHLPLLPRKRKRPQPHHRAGSLFVQPSALAGVAHRFRRRMYQPVSKPNTGSWCIKPVIFQFLAFVLCLLLNSAKINILCLGRAPSQQIAAKIQGQSTENQKQRQKQGIWMRNAHLHLTNSIAIFCLVFTLFWGQTSEESAAGLLSKQILLTCLKKWISKCKYLRLGEPVLNGY